jgi:hypothetical protein
LLRCAGAGTDEAGLTAGQLDHGAAACGELLGAPAQEDGVDAQGRPLQLEALHHGVAFDHVEVGQENNHHAGKTFLLTAALVGAFAAAFVQEIFQPRQQGVRLGRVFGQPTQLAVIAPGVGQPAQPLPQGVFAFGVDGG